MGSIDDEFARLRTEFDEHSVARIAAMRILVAALDRSRSDAHLLEQLHRDFHAFAGTGSTYSRPRVSDLGNDGEELTSRRLRDHTAASDDDVATLARLVDELSAAFAERRA